MITGILIITIIVFVFTSLFPGIILSNIVLGDSKMKECSSLKRYMIGSAVSAFTGISCTIAFFVLVPVVIIGAVLVFALIIISEIIGMMNGR